MATVSDSPAFGNVERLDVAKRKAKGVLGTLRDIAVIKTQLINIQDTGLLHPIRTLVPTSGIGGATSSSIAVCEHVISETEEGHVVRLLQQAHNAFSDGQFEQGKSLLKQSTFISSCTRCVGNISGIEDLIEKGDLYEARRRLSALVSLIPSYYNVIEGESKLRGEESESKVEKVSGRGSEKAELEEVCEECRVSEILETCHWDVSCIDAVIQYAEELKAKGEKVLSDKLLNKAKEYIGGDKKK